MTTLNCLNIVGFTNLMHQCVGLSTELGWQRERARPPAAQWVTLAAGLSVRLSSGHRQDQPAVVPRLRVGAATILREMDQFRVHCPAAAAAGAGAIKRAGVRALVFTLLVFVSVGAARFPRAPSSAGTNWGQRPRPECELPAVTVLASL